jgi:hypothetical protein
VRNICGTFDYQSCVCGFSLIVEFMEVVARRRWEFTEAGYAFTEMGHKTGLSLRHFAASYLRVGIASKVNAERNGAIVIPLFLLIWIGIGGGIGAAIGSSRGRGGLGFALGVLLGFIGWIFIAVMEPSAEERLRRTTELAKAMQVSSGAIQQRPESAERACPWCAELIKPAAVVCRFCGRDVPRMEYSAPILTASQELETWLRATSPRWAEEAWEHFGKLDRQPNDPKQWLTELCKRLDEAESGFR